MKVAVIGTGHVGLVTAATLASFGHEVSAVDSDAEKIDMLRRGEPPFFEPSLPELGWEPKVPLDTGPQRMVAWASRAWTT